MRRNLINFLYNPGHVTLWSVEVGPVANAREGSMQEHDWASVRKKVVVSKGQSNRFDHATSARSDNAQM